ncbi:DegV family protein [Alcanivoracaceae bacterium MT1]
MKTGLVVDSGCDLPSDFIKENGILVLPASIRIGDEIIADDRSPQRTRSFYDRQLLDKVHDAQSLPATVAQIKQLFLEQVVTHCDYALVETVLQSRSPIFHNATEAAHGILSEYRAVRDRAGLQGPFAVRVIDSQTLFAGQGALAAETVRLMATGMRGAELRARVSALAGKATGYAVVPDLYYLRQRARKKGDNSVGLVGALLGSALDIKPILCARGGETFPVAKIRGFAQCVARLFEHGTRCIEKGLLSPVLCVSYAGDPQAVYQMPGFEALKSCADRHQVRLLVSSMGLTGSVNIGPGALSIGLLTEQQDFR